MHNLLSTKVAHKNQWDLCREMFDITGNSADCVILNKIDYGTKAMPSVNF